MQNVITAHVQHCKVQLLQEKNCKSAAIVKSMAKKPLSSAKREAVERSIQAISAWRDNVMRAAEISAAEWGRRASMAPTNITRGMSPDATTVTKLENLHILARAAKVASPIDFLMSNEASFVCGAWSPSSESVQRLLEGAKLAAPDVRVSEADLQLIAHVLHAGLEHLSANPTKEGSQDYWDGVYAVMSRAVRDYQAPRGKAA